MRALSHPQEAPLLELGIPGFTFADLYEPAGLARLFDAFVQKLEQDEPALATSYRAHLQSKGELPTGLAKSELLIALGRHVSQFIAQLFRIQEHREGLRQALTGELALFEF